MLCEINFSDDHLFYSLILICAMTMLLDPKLHRFVQFSLNVLQFCNIQNAGGGSSGTENFIKSTTISHTRDD